MHGMKNSYKALYNLQSIIQEKATYQVQFAIFHQQRLIEKQIQR
jgi:hypothetical protein